MKIAAIIPVKTFLQAKSRLELSEGKKAKLCKTMLEEILSTLSISPLINEIVIVSKEKVAIELAQKFNAISIIDNDEAGVNEAVALADKYLIENNFNASVVLPQDIPYIKTQDIEFLLKFQTPPNFAIIVPSRRFDGTNALVRMPVDLMETHYDEDSYKIHMTTAKKYSRNVELVFVKRLMWDVDNMEDLQFLLQQKDKPQLLEKLQDLLK